MKRRILFALLIMGTALGASLNRDVNAVPRTTLFGTDTGNGNLVTVNLTTGAGTVVGNTGISSVPALAVDPATGILYLGQGGGNPTLHTVDPTTGAATRVGDSGLGFAAISGMDFSSTGTLYATVNIAGGGGTGGDHLATIDRTTGRATVIGPFGTCTDVIVPTDGRGSCSIEGIGGIAFDTSGNLWAVHHSHVKNFPGEVAPGQPGLYRVSMSSGRASFVTPIVNENGNAPPGGVTSIEFGYDGTLYGGTASVEHITHRGRLITIHTSSGRFEFAGTHQATNGALGGLAFHRSLDDDTRLPVALVTASDFQDPNVPENTLDQDLGTRWSAEGNGQWIEYDLGAPQTVNEVRIAWYRGDKRQANFDLEVSLDAANWTEVFSGSSGGSTLGLERYGFDPVRARYVRIVGYGNTENDWNSITEVEIIGRSNGPAITLTPVERTITHGAGVQSIYMIADVSPMIVDDLQDLGGKLIWEETRVNLCTDPTFPPVVRHKFISIRDVGDGFLRIGDGFETNTQGPGCNINTTMQNAFDDFGLPETACLSVRSGDINYEFCAPLNVIQ